MTEVRLQKNFNNMLMPVDDESFKAVLKIKSGQEVVATIKRQRNPQFHRKMFALFKLAFDFWEPAPFEPDPERKWMKDLEPEKNFDRFRKDLTILAGFYESYFRLNGEIRVEAKSISFAKMSQDEFEELYSRMIDVVLKNVLPRMTEQELRQSVEEMVLQFV